MVGESDKRLFGGGIKIADVKVPRHLGPRRACLLIALCITPRYLILHPLY